MSSRLACWPPRQQWGRVLQAPPARAGERSVLLVGNPSLPLKAFPVALAALAAVNRACPIRVRLNARLVDAGLDAHP